ncbi:hypothetical protein AQZ50_18755 [Novosphingobium sp. Fuku2-ISO-50]|nr:hypothetical protein AQZ50_18755 [Novosphingobium sp. Fuku2-ISO-50]
MQLRFRHRTFQAQQQPIVKVARIVNAIGICDQRIKQRTNLQELMPIPARACQAGHLYAQHQADMTKTNFRDKTLKPEPSLNRRARTPKIIVNHNNRLARPTQHEGTVDQRILQPR